VIEDLQDCMQQGVNNELLPHATHIGLLCGQEDPTNRQETLGLTFTIPYSLLIVSHKFSKLQGFLPFLNI
jgi:hypothetical protein